MPKEGISIHIYPGPQRLFIRKIRGSRNPPSVFSAMIPKLLTLHHLYKNKSGVCFPTARNFFAYRVDPHRNLLLQVETFQRKELFLSLTLFAFAGNIGRRLLESLPRHRHPGHRCKGCGRKDLLGIAEQTMQNVRQLRVITGDLCAGCQRLVDRLRQDDRIAAVFIFSRGKETKYYAAFRNSAS